MVFSEVAEDDDAAQANELMRHFNVFILWRRIIFYFFYFVLIIAVSYSRLSLPPL